MEVIVGIGDMKMSSGEEDVLITYSLGSCLGVAVYDPVVKIGGLIHAMLPKANLSSRRTSHNAFTYVDTGIPLLFKLAYLAGAEKKRLRVYLAGGASFQKDFQEMFSIGKRNLKSFHEVIMQEEISITNMEIGGNLARSMYLEVKTGKVWLLSSGKKREL